MSGRCAPGGVADGLDRAGCRFYRHLGTKSTLVAARNAEVGHALEADHELSLGGDTGLRGYPLRYQSGSGRALLTLEQRFYTNRSLWNLADIGGAIFFDAGRSWGASAFGPTENYGLLKDIGLGLRLGSTRSSLGNVLHIDIAFPLDGPRSLGTAQLVIQTKHSF
jgi:hemolysin activation/secretion protein